MLCTFITFILLNFYIVCCSDDDLNEIKCLKPNTTFSLCGDINPITCANKDRLRIISNDCLQKGGCVCIDGYVKNYKGDCILSEDCPKCNSFEVFDCKLCEETCTTLGQSCPIQDNCLEKCYCINGFVKNNNVCIPIKQCPPQKCDGINEIFNVCPSRRFERTCEDNGFEAEYEVIKCIPRCECLPNYIRKTRNGECVQLKEC